MFGFSYIRRRWIRLIYTDIKTVSLKFPLSKFQEIGCVDIPLNQLLFLLLINAVIIPFVQIMAIEWNVVAMLYA